ncbi:hypothetical protein [Streptomyces xanthophaeus]
MATSARAATAQKRPLVVYQDRSHGGPFTDKRFAADALAFLRNDRP